MSPELVLWAYRRGIFPWTESPVRWFSPDPRAVFEEVHIPKRVRRVIRQQKFQVSYDQAFADVIRACAFHHRSTWISPLFIRTFSQLHRAGHAHSLEVWLNQHLVGGLYGIQIGGYFSGESMFHRVSDASKVALFFLDQKLQQLGVELLDAQVLTPHTHRLGARNIRRRDFLARLEQAVDLPVPAGLWTGGSCPGGLG